MVGDATFAKLEKESLKSGSDVNLDDLPRLNDAIGFIIVSIRSRMDARSLVLLVDVSTGSSISQMCHLNLDGILVDAASLDGGGYDCTP